MKRIEELIKKKDLTVSGCELLLFSLIKYNKINRDFMDDLETILDRQQKAGKELKWCLKRIQDISKDGKEGEKQEQISEIYMRLVGVSQHIEYVEARGKAMKRGLLEDGATTPMPMMAKLLFLCVSLVGIYKIFFS